ncbi:MAG: TIGR02206 family membrane protein [Flavobacteriales bacterium]|nr:TIGR02206 family membrane protein [Flavobacteriales bacterium]
MKEAIVKDVVIGFNEPRLYILAAATVIFYLILLRVVARQTPKTIDKITNTLGVLFLLLSAGLQVSMLMGNTMPWTIHKSIPLHLCQINFILTGINFLIRKRWLWEISTFWGLIGGIHAFITPQLTMGDAPYFLFFYYFQHGALIFMPIYLWKFYGFRFRKWGWLRVYFITLGYAVFTFTINWILNTFFPGDYMANYFYVSAPPKADNPLIMGGWPWYLIPSQIIFILHVVIINMFFRWQEKQRPLWV